MKNIAISLSTHFTQVIKTLSKLYWSIIYHKINRISAKNTTSWRIFPLCLNHNNLENNYDLQRLLGTNFKNICILLAKIIFVSLSWYESFIKIWANQRWSPHMTGSFCAEWPYINWMLGIIITLDFFKLLKV